MQRFALTLFTVLTLSCYAHEYVGPDHRPYRHERWHGEDVYQHEDGRWYVRREHEWVVRPEVVIK